MSIIYPLNVRRRVERIEMSRKIHSQVIAVAEQALQRVFNNNGSLVPVPVRTIFDRKRFDQSRLHD